jgi:hypothetical protein
MITPTQRVNLPIVQAGQSDSSLSNDNRKRTYSREKAATRKKLEIGKISFRGPC